MGISKASTSTSLEKPKQAFLQEGLGISSITKKIQDKIHAILNRLAFGNQLDQIATIQKTYPKLAASKRESLNDHIRQVSIYEKFSLAIKLRLEKINFIRTLLIRNSIHPATSAYTFENMAESYADTPLDLKGGFMQVYTKDHQQLDGMVIYGNASKDKNRPTLVMSLGNMMVYEQIINYAQTLASQNQVNIVLYNPRGVGLSLGEELSTDDAVEDCKAVIKYAHKELCGGEAKLLGVFGHSLGGGITAEALKQLQDEKIVKKINLYVNHNSFPSLHKCFEGLTGLNSGKGRAALGILGLNPLNAGKTLATRKVASNTVVLTAGDDQVMKGEGRLSNYLQKVLSAHKHSEDKTKSHPHKEEDLKSEITLSPVSTKKRPKIEIDFHTHPGADHNTWNDDCISESLQRAFNLEEEISKLQL